MKKIFNNIINFLVKIHTHNRCDDCGFTKDKVYITEYYTESGHIQCTKCINKQKLKQNANTKQS